MTISLLYKILRLCFALWCLNTFFDWEKLVEFCPSGSILAYSLPLFSQWIYCILDNLPSDSQFDWEASVVSIGSYSLICDKVISSPVPTECMILVLIQIFSHLLTWEIIFLFGRIYKKWIRYVSKTYLSTYMKTDFSSAGHSLVSWANGVWWYNCYNNTFF